ncbi:MAG: hypothetical protein PHQ02_00290 [Candidatus Riflebacteria bacterium]|nr:hypothetical protein [Candidatus Riflebacteria bacterium]
MAKNLKDDEIKWIISLESSGAQKSIHELTQESKNLEKANKATRQEMKELEAQGKKNSSEWLASKKSIEENNTAIDVNRKKVDQLEKQLKIEDMTMKQLRKSAKELQMQLDAMEPSDPAWTTLKQQLDDTKNRMGDLRNQGNTLIQTMAAMPNPIGAATQSVLGFQKGLIAIATNPVGAVLTALGLIITGLVKSFQRFSTASEEGAQRTASAMAPLKVIAIAIGDAFEWVGEKVVNTFTGIGKIVANTVKYLSDNFGIMTDVNEKMQRQYEIEEKQYALQQKQKSLILEQKEAEAQMLELKHKMMQKDKYDAKEREGFVLKYQELERGLFNTKEQLAKEELELTKMKAAQDDNTLQDNIAIKEAEAKVVQSRIDSAHYLMELEEKNQGIKAELLAKDKADKKKSIEDNLKAVDQGIADEKIALAKQYAGGLIDKSNYNKQLEELELESLRRKLSIYGLEESKRKEIEQKIADYAIKMREQFSIKGVELEKAKEISITSIQKKESENLKKISEQNLKIKQAEYAKEKELELKQRQEMVQLATAFSTEMGGIIGGALAGNDDMIKQSMVSIINMGLDYLKVQAQMAIAGATMQSLATPDSILTFGAAGLSRAAILTGLIEAAFAAVKSVVGSMVGNIGSESSTSTSTSQGTVNTIVPQRAEGKYDVIGSTDGRQYRNVPYIGTPQSGIIENPSLISEHGGELIISSPDMEMLKKDIRYPIMIQAINDARDRRVFQRAEGKYDQIAQSSESTSNAFVPDTETKKLNNRLITLLSRLEKNGVNIKYGHIEKSVNRANIIRTKTSRK